MTTATMDFSAEDILPHVPYLRRLARALTGSSEAGDGLVATVIENAMSGALPWHGRGGRVPLYRALVRTFGPRGPLTRQSDGPLHPLERALDSLDENARRAFLLVTLESLDFHDAAFVLDKPEAAVREDLVRARDALDNRIGASILIVEDDAVIARDLAETVAGMGHKVCGVAATPDEAMQAVRDDAPTLALVDLHLAHGTTGKQTVIRLREVYKGLPVIFVTAFAEELLRDRGFAMEPIIRKPFTREQIETAITQAVFTPDDQAA
ncbi:MAG TPA: response regulator [Azospirillaceae bacterium]|nr:response regulator [Azospirillaceae bacterium]